jgi:hypothetical protein
VRPAERTRLETSASYNPPESALIHCRDYYLQAGIHDPNGARRLAPHWPKRNHRVVCIDEMRFDASRGTQPLTITKEGVNRDPIAE